MSLVSPTVALASNLDAANFAFIFAQLYDTCVAVNGRDTNKAVFSRTGVGVELGIAAPTNSPAAGVTYGAGSLNGAFLYRYRWVDALRGKTYSNACVPFAANPATQGVIITRNEAPPSRATHVIIERTEEDGTIFYPVNTSATSPFGTAISGTPQAYAVDTVTDLVLSQGFSIPNAFGIPKPMGFCFANLNQIFMGGARAYNTTVGLTSGSPAVTGTGFVPSDAGRDMTVKGANISYQVLTYNSPTSLTLSTNFVGATASYSVAIANQGNLGIVSQPSAPEGYGKAAVSPYSGLSNEFTIGPDANILTSGIGLGTQGVVWAKQNQLFLHTYSINPLSTTGDARITQLPTARGALTFRCLEYAEGLVYGADAYGFWRMTPGDIPQDISALISNDFKAQFIKLRYYYNFFIKFDPYARTVNYFVIYDNTHIQHPNYCYRWSIDSNKWIDCIPFDVMQTGATVLPDQFGIRRLITVNKAEPSRHKAYAWFHGIGITFGANPSNAPLYGTASSGSTSTIVKTGAAFLTTDDGLQSVPVRRIRGFDTSSYTIEDTIISSNTVDTLTVFPLFSDATVAGDRFIIGAIKSRYRSGRISLDKLGKGNSPEKINTLQLWLWLRYQQTAAEIYVAFYKDGNFQRSEEVWKVSSIIDGVTTVNGRDFASVDSTTEGINIFNIPIGIPMKDIQIEIFSFDSNEPWSILDCKLNVDLYNDSRVER